MDVRRLMYVSLGFGAGCVLGAYVFSGDFLWIGGILALILGAVMLLLASESRAAFRIALLTLGCAAGLLRFGLFYSFYLDTPASLDGKIMAVTFRASDYSRETEYGRSVDGVAKLGGKSYQVRAYLDPGEVLEPGSIVSGDFRLRATTPDGEEEGTYHPGRGIFLLAYQQGAITETKSEQNWQDFPAKLRLTIKNALKASFPEDVYPFVLALLLGDGSELDYETDTDMKVGGIRHVVAVSGLHVSILFALISTITFKKRFLTALLGFPVLAIFAAVAGFTPSVVRACIMSGLMLLALLFDKEYDGATALSFAALVMLLYNPMVITSVSFQLSVASVAGIYLFSADIKKWMLSGLQEEWNTPIGEFFAQWISGSVSLTLSAMTLTTPLCAYHFGAVSLIGVVVNLLTLWVISTIFYGAMGVCILFIWAPAGAVWLAKLVAWPVRYVLVVTKALAGFPLAAVYTASPYIVAWLVFVYMLLVIFLVSKYRRALVLGCCAVVGLCMALTASWAEPMLGSVRFTVLDVGQGQCLLFQTEGGTYMIDCGGDSDEAAADLAAQTLLSQGITKLDGIFLTHLDRDHAGGVEHLLTRIDTELLVLPNEYSELSKCTYGDVIYAAEDLILTCGEMKIHIITPTFEGNSNEISLCLLLDTKKCDILITGDRSGYGERMLLHNKNIGDVDILVAGHHGSGNSTTEGLLAAVRPEVVCISVGEDNSYGHPAAELLLRLQEFGCTVYRTDKHGTILIRR